jgi:SAM-dependent methyltransferase
MNNGFDDGVGQLTAYGNLCSQFYDATKAYAPEKEVDFFASFIEQNPGRVLEAMSGSGRLQIPLMQRGYVVDGVDNSPAMLARCRQRCAELGLQPELYEQSLESLSLPHTYATVTIAVSSFQLITDRAVALKALQNLHMHMLPEGNLLLDIFVPDRDIDKRSVRMARLDDHRVIRLTTRHMFDEEKKLADAYCCYELLVDGVVQQQEDEFMQVVWRSDDEWQKLLGEAGFEIVTIYDETFRSSGPSRVIHAVRV